MALDPAYLSEPVACLSLTATCVAIRRFPNASRSRSYGLATGFLPSPTDFVPGRVGRESSESVALYSVFE